MGIKSLVSGVAVALVVTVGGASAADGFKVLDGIEAAPMNTEELASVRGANSPAVIIAVTGEAATLLLDDPTGNSPPPIVIDPNGVAHAQQT